MNKIKTNLGGKKQVYKEVIDILCGHKIGEGCTREVYECRVDHKLVVKIARNPTDNITEWCNWLELERYKEVSKWLAPCVDISYGGRVLLQKKVKPIYKLPKKLPSFITDTKPANFGIYKGRIVCVDYAIMLKEYNVEPRKVTKYYRELI